MVDKTTHDDYIKLYKELVNRVNQKEDIIQEMTEYIAKYGKKTDLMCDICDTTKCNIKKCRTAIRKYFERD